MRFRNGELVLRFGVIAVIGSCALLSASVEAQQVPAQQAKPMKMPATPQSGDPSDDSKSAQTDSITLPTDRKSRRSIEVAEDFVKQEMWGEAARVLQSLLDSKEDVFVEVSRNDQIHWVSLRREANRLIGAMPLQGRQFYELQYGARGKARLNEAKAQSDPNMLAEVAQRYMHTEAGAEANDLLGTYHLDRGNVIQSALCYERLLERGGPEKLAARSLFKAAIAFQRAGYMERADQVWQLLTRATGREGVSFGQRNISLEKLKSEMGTFGAVAQAASAYDWALYRGNVGRSAQGLGSAPFLQPKWSEPTFREPQTQQWMEQVLKQPQQREPVLPTYFPVAVTVRLDRGPVPLLVYRTHSGLQARDLSTNNGKLEWATQGLGGYDNLIADTEKKLLLDSPQWNWIGSFMSSNPNFICENSTVGTLSADNQYAYIIEDLVLPPHPSSPPMNQFQWGQQPQLGKLTDQVYHNRLEAFDLRTGKFTWFLGGRHVDKDETTDAGKLSDCYFLGPPLPIGDKLYVLIDKNSELRLVCLERSREDKQPPTIAWIQTLAHVRDKMILDIGRRVHAAHLSYGDGILICPTNAGVILGIDVLSQSFAWAHPYRDQTPAHESNDAVAVQRRRMQMMANGQPMLTPIPIGWKTSAPVIAAGKVVFTAPDSGAVHCLDLRSGELLWKQTRRKSDLYLAGVFDGKVLIVGNTCRAYDLATGKEIWQTQVGLPSGQGVASDNVYYLPLRTGAESQKPEVCALDVPTGRIIGGTIARPDDAGKYEVPGNLLFFEGDVVSQTAERVTVYRQLKYKRQDIEVALQANANDPNGLFQRGEIRLEEGDLRGAVDDLRGAIKNHPAPDLLEKTKAKLYQTFTKLIQRDFDAAEQFLPEYAAMCEVAIPPSATSEQVKSAEEERQRRRCTYLCLLGKGREKQGRVTDAFQAYMEFGAHASPRELVSGLDDPTIRARPDVWVQGRVASMLARVTSEQAKPIAELIRQHWEIARTRGDLQEMRRFVGMFGPVPGIGDEARLFLAERLIEDNGVLEAELHLLQLRRHAGPPVAGQAVELLARLAMRKNLLEDAAHWYRVLGTEFATGSVRDGKTGSQYLDDLTTDKRLLPYLEDTRLHWAGGRIRAKEEFGPFGGQVNHVLEPVGEVLPFFKRHCVTLQNHAILKVIDRQINEPRLSETLSSGGENVNYFANPNANVRAPCYVQGHLMVVQVGDRVHAFDTVERRKIWDYSLQGADAANQPKLVTHVPHRDGALRMAFTDGYMQSVGRIGAVKASYVGLLTREGLVVLDPINGSVLWTKSELPENTEVMGDEQNVYLIDVNKRAASNARAFRARDGAAVNVPDFAPAFQKRLRVQDGSILISEVKGDVRLMRRYEAVSGRDVWERRFASSALVLQSETLELLGVIDSQTDGKVEVFESHSWKTVLAAQLDSIDTEKMESVHLLADLDLIYIACNRRGAAAGGAGINPGQVFSNVNNTLRCLPVNGAIYAFDRATGKLRWKQTIPEQMLVLDQYQDIPILIFTAFQHRAAAGGFNRNGFTPTASTRSIEKRTGKRVYDSDSIRNHGFYSIVTNVKAGTIELVGNQMKIIHYIEGANGAGDAPPAVKPEVPGIQRLRPDLPKPDDRR